MKALLVGTKLDRLPKFLSNKKRLIKQKPSFLLSSYIMLNFIFSNCLL